MKKYNAIECIIKILETNKTIDMNDNIVIARTLQDSILSMFARFGIQNKFLAPIYDITEYNKISINLLIKITMQQMNLIPTKTKIPRLYCAILDDDKKTLILPSKNINITSIVYHKKNIIINNEHDVKKYQSLYQLEQENKNKIENKLQELKTQNKIKKELKKLTQDELHLATNELDPFAYKPQISTTTKELNTTKITTELEK